MTTNWSDEDLQAHLEDEFGKDKQVRSAAFVAKAIMHSAPWKRLYIVPVRISREPMYQLAIRVKSRNGMMLKHVQGTRPFPESRLEAVKRHLVNGVVDLSLDPIYINEACAQPALDAGRRVRIVVEPFEIDPYLVQLARRLQRDWEE